MLSTTPKVLLKINNFVLYVYPFLADEKHSSICCFFMADSVPHTAANFIFKNCHKSTIWIAPGATQAWFFKNWILNSLKTTNAPEKSMGTHRMDPRQLSLLGTFRILTEQSECSHKMAATGSRASHNVAATADFQSHSENPCAAMATATKATS